MDRPAAGAIAYVMTHYPRVALTFVHGEVEALEQIGFGIHPFAMNTPDEADLRGPGFEAERARTIYLKASWPAAVGAYLALFARHPFGLARINAGLLRAMARGPGSFLRALSHLAQAALLARYCRERAISHIHAHFGLAPATIAWLASRILRLTGLQTQFSFTIHGFQDFVEPSARLDLKSEAAAFVVCISDFTRSQLFRITDPSSWRKFVVVRCGIDLARLTWRRPPPPDHKVRLITIGRLSAEKGFPILLEAIARIDPARCQLECLVVGDGPLRAGLEAQAARLGLADAVTFAGELVPTEVALRLAESDIFCLPSFNEGLPVSIMEAMARGVPVIATSIAGIPELAVDRRTALVVPPGNVEALHEAIVMLACDRELSAALAQRARAAVAERHDRTASARQLAALFEASFA